MSGPRTPRTDKSWHQREVERLEKEITDLKQALAGDMKSKALQEIKVKLENVEGQLAARLRRARRGYASD